MINLLKKEEKQCKNCGSSSNEYGMCVNKMCSQYGEYHMDCLHCYGEIGDEGFCVKCKEWSF